jgi:ribonuclease HII
VVAAREKHQPTMIETGVIAIETRIEVEVSAEV